MLEPLHRLLDGFAEFRREHFIEAPELFRSLIAEGQRPDVLIVGCSDSRVDPAIMTKADPGQLFIVRNVAAIVPPYHPGADPTGTASAIEFGVKGLGVRHIVVLGHEACGGMRLLSRADSDEAAREFEFVARWVSIVGEARDGVMAMGLPAERVGHAVEQAALLTSVTNLLSFPWVAERVTAGTLALHAWYFSLTAGELLVFDGGVDRFRPAREALAEPAVGVAPDAGDGMLLDRFLRHL